jgi:hypothetical protein
MKTTMPKTTPSTTRLKLNALKTGLRAGGVRLGKN